VHLLNQASLHWPYQAVSNSNPRIYIPLPFGLAHTPLMAGRYAVLAACFFFTLKNHMMELLWYFSDSLTADYGTFTCLVCDKVFHYSPRLDCHCNSCAINTLQRLLDRTKEEARRRQLQAYIKTLKDCE